MSVSRIIIKLVMSLLAPNNYVILCFFWVKVQLFANFSTFIVSDFIFHVNFARQNESNENDGFIGIFSQLLIKHSLIRVLP